MLTGGRLCPFDAAAQGYTKSDHAEQNCDEAGFQKSATRVRIKAKQAFDELHGAS